ncbi:metal ABC transporter ATP-binding protein [Enterococcus sp.]|jgi:manganese-transporting ATPase|uniref:metal ABC transporter ATP-binding protein n=1 Tax=Enterococcus sp. TaxID=35783 RepID=UPI0025B8B265|nr:metal ABC transporter ATP-binding protein [Enterococcus sp.]
MLTFSDISASYDGKNQAITGLSFTVDQPAIVGIVGPNGAGKSTFIKAALQLIPSEGTVTSEGKKLNTFQKTIAYVEQKTAVDYTFPITVKEVVSLGLYPQLTLFQRIKSKEWQKVTTALESVQMADFAERQIGELSGGQFQRVLIARTLVQDAKYIFLDEPFVGIDAMSEAIIIDLLRTFREQGKTIFIVHHDLGKVTEYFDELVMMNQRLIAYGPTASVFTEANLKKTFGDAIIVKGGVSDD